MIDLSAIPGISAATARKLGRLGLFSSDDLLRADRISLAGRVSGLTPEAISKWQGFAELMLIDDMTLEAAAALHSAGAGSAQAFAGWPLARARAALPISVDDEKIVAWMKDAVRLVHTGVLNGNVRLKDGTPVEGAIVTVAGVDATTDGRGRFRVTRLPLHLMVTVTVFHPTLGYKLAKRVPVAPGSALVGQLFVLAGRVRIPKRLSELHGDVLPPLGSASITSSALPDAPSRSDILMFIDHYADGDGRLASRFLDFDAGRFVRRTYRMAASTLPARLKAGDDIAWNGRRWTRASYSARDMTREVRRRRVEARFPEGKRTLAEFKAAMRAAAAAYTDR